MVTIGKCVFSGGDVPKSKGMVKVTADGKPNLLMNRKCRVFFENNTKAQKVLWTSSSRYFHRKGSAVHKEKKQIIKLPKIIKGFPMVPQKTMQEISEKAKNTPIDHTRYFRETEKLPKNLAKQNKKINRQ